MESPFERLFRPPTEEEKTEANRRVLTKHKETEQLCRRALPILAEAREELYQLMELGIECEELTKARRQLALLQERLEGALHRPPARAFD